MTNDGMPSDFWHTYIYVMLSMSCCDACGREIDVPDSCHDVSPELDYAIEFTLRAVKHLQAAGWGMIDDRLHCPDCVASKRGIGARHSD